MSDEALYGLDAETVDWLHQLRDTTRGVRTRQGETLRQPAPGFHPVEKYLALTTSAISAATVADTTLATLASDINSSAQSLTVSSTASMPAGRMFVLSIGFEKILVTAIVSSTVINAVRGYDSTTAAGHS